MKQLNDNLYRKVYSANGIIVGVSSEPQSHVDEARKMWNIDFEMYGDPNHYLGQYLIKERVLPELVIVDSSFLESEEYSNEKMRKWFASHQFMNKYKYGVAQPAVSIIMGWDKESKEDNCHITHHQSYEVVYSMAVKPKLVNGYGAADRPDILQMWNSFEKQVLSFENVRISESNGMVNEGKTKPTDNLVKVKRRSLKDSTTSQLTAESRSLDGSRFRKVLLTDLLQIRLHIFNLIVVTVFTLTRIFGFISYKSFAMVLVSCISFMGATIKGT